MTRNRRSKNAKKVDPDGDTPPPLEPFPERGAALTNADQIQIMRSGCDPRRPRIPMSSSLYSENSVQKLSIARENKDDNEVIKSLPSLDPVAKNEMPAKKKNTSAAKNKSSVEHSNSVVNSKPNLKKLAIDQEAKEEFELMEAAQASAINFLKENPYGAAPLVALFSSLSRHVRGIQSESVRHLTLTELENELANGKLKHSRQVHKYVVGRSGNPYSGVTITRRPANNSTNWSESDTIPDEDAEGVVKIALLLKKIFKGAEKEIETPVDVALHSIAYHAGRIQEATMGKEPDDNVIEVNLEDLELGRLSDSLQSASLKDISLTLVQEETGNTEDSDDTVSIGSNNDYFDSDETVEREDAEPEGTQEQINCLICDTEGSDMKSVLAHMDSEHNLSFKNLYDEFRLNEFGFRKVVNFLRKYQSDRKSNEPNSIGWEEGLRNFITTKPKPGEENLWMSDLYLFPVIPDDPFLRVDFDILVELSDSLETQIVDENRDSNIELIKHLKNVISTMSTEKAVMQGVMNRLIGTEDEVTSNPSKKNRQSQLKIDRSEDEDSYYFESYDEIGIHAQMLKDLPRTGAYQRSICENLNDIRGKVVMDLGCGTGILSMFCADSGAKTVHAIDCSNIIYDAMENVFDNNLGDTIKCHKGRLETMPLDIGKVDVLVSEFMGYFLIYEGMLNSYLYARDNFLKPGGKMLPSSAEMLIIGISDEGRYRSEIDSWERVYGFKMESMKKRALKEPAIQDIDPISVVSEPVVVKSLNLHTCTTKDTIIDDTFQLEILKDSTLTAIGGYFSVGFNDGSQHKEELSTSPMLPPTHWKHCVFYLPQKVHNLKRGTKVPVKMVCKPHDHNPRWLAIDITVNGVRSSYELR